MPKLKQINQLYLNNLMKEEMIIQEMYPQLLMLNLLFPRIVYPQFWNLMINVLKESFNKEILHYFYSTLLQKNLQLLENNSIKLLLKEEDQYYLQQLNPMMVMDTSKDLQNMLELIPPMFPLSCQLLQDKKL